MEGKIKTTQKTRTVKELCSEIDLLNKKLKQFENIFDNNEFDKAVKRISHLESFMKKFETNKDSIEKLKQSKIVTENHSSKFENTNVSQSLNLNNKDLEKTFKCNECKIVVKNKRDLKAHIKVFHQNTKEIICKDCNKTFKQNWELELHSKEHNKENQFKCTVCDKSFLLEWRLNKHLENHNDTKKKIFCHYFNNQKLCPYEEIGCMFLHKENKPCKNEGECKRILCQFRHANSDGGESNIEINKKEICREKAISCDQCNFEATNDETIKIHKQTVHELVYNCKTCEFKTTDERTLLVHMKGVHLGEMTTCIRCKTVIGTNSCIDCNVHCCKSCVASMNKKDTMEYAKRKGIIDEDLKSDKCICSSCFKKRCTERNLLN